MRVELPNAGFAELRDVDRLTGGDRRAYKAAIKFKVNTGADSQEIAGDVQERQRNAVLRRLIFNWAVKNPGNGQMFPIPLSQGEDDPNPVLDEIPLDTYDVLIEAIKPHMDKLEKAGKSSETSEPGSSDGPPPADPTASETSP